MKSVRITFGTARALALVGLVVPLLTRPTAGMAADLPSRKAPEDTLAAPPFSSD